MYYDTVVRYFDGESSVFVRKAAANRLALLKPDILLVAVYRVMMKSRPVNILQKTE
ncbi:MAG TPA: hypothetical protein IAA05_10415 [Candidatus Blautia excrementipullorum]|nr:hypothetical protein [Candidatus Blautia excrementipullorum]